MVKKKALILLLFVIYINSFAQSKMLTGNKHLIFVEIPKNWVQAPNDQIPFLIKPNETNISEITYMYVYGLDYASVPDLNLWIEGNNSELKKDIPDVKIEQLDLKFENIKADNFLTGNYKTVCYTYPGIKKEALLVIESKTTIFTAVLSAKDTAEFDKYLGSFKELVNSLKMQSANVKQE
ncbi:hypothetical protein SAMN04487979_11717 [Flavobacterium sp. ov086]|nr:hypothetical protein SAMN04487979_11717 [Flavobacterium sp. ov086]